MALGMAQSMKFLVVSLVMNTERQLRVYDNTAPNVPDLVSGKLSRAGAWLELGWERWLKSLEISV